MVDQHGLGADHVADRDQRQTEPIGASRRWIGRGRAGGAHAAADHVRGDDKIAIRVDRPPGPDHRLPPARLAGDRMGIGHMLIAGQRMADEDRIGLGRVQRAIGLIGDRQRAQAHARVHLERLVGTKADDETMRRVRLEMAHRSLVRDDRQAGARVTGSFDRSLWRTQRPVCRSGQKRVSRPAFCAPLPGRAAALLSRRG